MHNYVWLWTVEFELQLYERLYMCYIPPRNTVYYHLTSLIIHTRVLQNKSLYLNIIKQFSLFLISHIIN